jgi:hypothetical protein
VFKFDSLMSGWPTTTRRASAADASDASCNCLDRKEPQGAKAMLKRHKNERIKCDISNDGKLLYNSMVREENISRE